MIDELIFWLVAVVFCPFIIKERWRRYCERRTEAGAAAEQAADDLHRNIRLRLREIKREKSWA